MKPVLFAQAAVLITPAARQHRAARLQALESVMQEEAKQFPDDTTLVYDYEPDVAAAFPESGEMLLKGDKLALYRGQELKAVPAMKPLACEVINRGNPGAIRAQNRKPEEDPVDFVRRASGLIRQRRSRTLGFG